MGVSVRHIFKPISYLEIQLLSGVSGGYIISSDYYYLDNDKALHHLIFEMTKWKPEEIRRLSLNDCLFIIASQLKPSYMSEDAAAVLASLNLPTGHYPVEDFPQEDWDPRENSAFLQSYQ
ncbi:TPA: hypothetical protein OT873_004625 [Klebsiella pneumoniae]|nr:hypothetical protein [Klebsiella pneumoniae]